MKKRPKNKVIIHQDIFAKVSRHKGGQYTYRSPFYGYKIGYRHNIYAYIYLMKSDNADINDAIYLEVKGFKYATLKDIKEYLVNYVESSPRYRMAKHKLAGSNRD